MGIRNWIKRWISTDGTGPGYTYTGDGNFHRGRFNSGTIAGPAINEQTAMTIPAFFHAMRLFGNVIGSQDWDVVEIDPVKRTRTIAVDHPVHWLLHHEPNEFQTAQSFRSTLIGHSMSYGNGYAYIQRNGNFRPIALLPLLPDRTKPIRRNGELVYETIVNGQTQELQPYQVYHVPGFGGNGITGYPIVQLMKNTLGLSKAEEEFAAQFFGNGCNFGGVVTMEGTLEDAALKNLKASMREENGGLANAFKNLFLEEGMKWQPASTIDPQKSQMVEARSFQLADLARVVGLTPHLLYDLSRSTNNNIEHQGIEAVTYSFKPISNQLCQEGNRKLLYESEKGRFETVIDLKPLMAGDSNAQAQADQILFNTGSITPNEIRAKRGLNPIEGGDQLFINIATMPLNLVIEKAKADILAAETAAAAAAASADQAALVIKTEADIAAADKGSKTAPQPDDEIDGINPEAGQISDPDGQPGPAAPANLTDDIRSAAIKPWVEMTVARLMRRDAKAIRSAAAKYAGDDDQFSKWFMDFQAETRERVIEDMSPVGNAEAIADAWQKRTQADIEQLLTAKPSERAAMLNQIIEQWQERREQLTNQIVEDK